MYNRIEYNSNYSETTGSLWLYSKDEANNFYADIGNTNSFIFFRYEAKLLENTSAQPAPNKANGILKNPAIAVPLKYLSNFWRSLQMPLSISKLNGSLNGQSNVFWMEMAMIMLIVMMLIILFLLSKTENYMSLL